MKDKEKDKGKNIYIKFVDDAPTSTADIEERTEESINREKIYDNEISPIVQQLIEKCKEHKMPLFVECEYNSGDFCKTGLNPKEWNPHPGFTTLDVITQCFQRDGVNIDKYFMWLLKQVKEAGGHGSIYLSMLGYKVETGEYDWSQAYHMLLGAKPEDQKE